MSTFNALAFPGALQRGARDTNPSGPVHRLQDYLKLHGYDPGPTDGDFGVRTQTAMSNFQFENCQAWQPDLGTLEERTWKALTAPLARAMDTLPVRAIAHSLRNVGSDLSLGGAVEATARQWTAQSIGGVPLRELPGNSGPVVEACNEWLAKRDRLPCVCGHEATFHGVDACAGGYGQRHGSDPVCSCTGYRPDWRLPWCAGWVSTVLRQACESLGVEMPIRGSLSCDELARQAAAANLLWLNAPGYLMERAADAKVKVPLQCRPGDLFLVRGEQPGDWTHCGVVLHFQHLPRGKARIITAEGNTNANGSRNGDRLLERTRPITGLDFICWRGE